MGVAAWWCLLLCGGHVTYSIVGVPPFCLRVYGRFGRASKVRSVAAVNMEREIPRVRQPPIDSWLTSSWSTSTLMQRI